MAKKLEKVLSKLDEDTLIKIGAKDGAAFFFCGMVKDFVKNSSKYSNKCRARSVHLAERAKHNVVNWTEKNPYKDSEYEFWITNLYRLSEKAFDYYNQNLEFKDLDERTVRDVFKANKVSDEFEPTVIIVDGYEIGRYWTIAESMEENKQFGIGTMFKPKAA